MVAAGELARREGNAYVTRSTAAFGAQALLMLGRGRDALTLLQSASTDAGSAGARTVIKVGYA